MLGTYTRDDHPVDTVDPDDDRPVPPIEDHELPDSTDDGETPATAYDDFKPED